MNQDEMMEDSKEDVFNDTEVLLWNFSSSIEELIESGYTPDGIRSLLEAKIKEITNG